MSRLPATLYGPRVLLSKTALSIALFWVLLGLLYLLPTPARDVLRGAPEVQARAPALPTASGPAEPAPTELEPGAATDNGKAAENAGGTEHTGGGGETVQPIEDPHGSLGYVARALAKLEKEKRGVVRVLHYGDSQIDLDHVSGQMRKRWQKRYGDGGHGFAPPARPWRWFYQPGIQLRHKGTIHRYLLSKSRGDGRLGLGLQAVEPRDGPASLYINTSHGAPASRIRLAYLERPGGGHLELRVDGERVALRSTSGPRARSRFIEKRVADGPHRIKVRMRGRVRVFGVTLERAGPGVTWENLPMVSLRFQRMAAVRADHWKEQLAHRAPKLVVFQFGTNDTISYGGSIAAYGRRVAKVLRWLHEALPHSSCLVIGPLERMERGRGGKLETPRSVALVSARQRQVALANVCAFWDPIAAIGGPGSLKRWLHRRMLRKDRVHLNLKGSRALASLLDRALQQSLRRHAR